MEIGKNSEQICFMLLLYTIIIINKWLIFRHRFYTTNYKNMLQSKLQTKGEYMKMVKMSLLTALLVGSSAFAIENTKISGNANLFYSTDDSGKSELFDKTTSTADIGLNLNVTSDLIKNDSVSISGGAGYTALTSLGLENNLVSGVWGGAHSLTTPTGASFGAPAGAKVENASWFNEAWIAATSAKTTVKVGRMELDTPLAFTETWSIEKNTFEAALLINQDIPDTTIVTTYIGNGNGTEGFGQTTLANGSAGTTGVLVNTNGKFGTYGTDGAYAAGIINNSFKPLTFQAWYYDVSKLAQAYWLQADIECSLVDGLLIGAQYSGVKQDVSGSKEDNAYAVMLGYDWTDILTAKVAYSGVNKDGSLGRAAFNTATDSTYAQTKLYTETWWNYGQVTMSDTTTTNVTIESPVQGIFDLGLYVYMIDHGKESLNADGSVAKDLTEITLSASKSFGPLDAALVAINTDVDGADDSVNIVQVYLTLNF